MTAERPDATRALSDNDMNSFLPITFHPHDYDAEFTSGYRIYRAFALLPKSKNDRAGALQITAVNVSELAIFVNGEQIYGGSPTPNCELTATLPDTLTPGERFELRLLARAIEGYPSGIRGNLRLSFV